MAETLTFANYRLDSHRPEDIYAIGQEQDGLGVIPEIAKAFDYQLDPTPSVDNLGDLIAVVGPAKELKDNIAGVQEALGTSDDAVSLARNWVERSGLLTPVEQSYFSTEPIDNDISLGVITGGIRNWMARRADRLSKLHETRGLDQAMLVAGNRVMKTSEGPDVNEGMTESDYMRGVIAKQLADLGIALTIVEVESGIGDDVMAAGANKVRKLVGPYESIAVVSNAGGWTLNVGQFRRALKDVFGDDYDQAGQNVLAVADGFPIGRDTEPAATHQNPFSALGAITRGAQELAKHYE